MVSRVYVSPLFAEAEDDEDDDVIYLPAVTYNLEEEEAEEEANSPFPLSPLIYWPSIGGRRSLLTSRASSESLRGTPSTQSAPEADFGAFQFKEPYGLRRMRSVGEELTKSNAATAPPVGRLRQRRSAVSAAATFDQPVGDIGFQEEVLDQFGMPIKKNTLRITARFIGSLQKHTVQKAKAERVAAAAALATYLNDPGSKESDGGILCDPCNQENGSAGKLTGDKAGKLAWRACACDVSYVIFGGT